MQILVGVVGEVVVDYDVHTLNVNSSAKDIRSHHDALLEVLENFEAFDSLVLRYTGVDAHGGEGRLDKESVKGVSACSRLDEDNHLVEL